MSNLESGSVILVTGATGGVGLEIAAQAAASGAVVGVHGSRPETVASAMARITERVPTAQLIAAPGDFREAGVIEEVVARVVQEGGRLDALIHCAISGAAETSGPFRQTNPKFYGQLAQNILGIFQQVCFAAVPHLAEQKGTIIAFASDAGRFAAPRQTMVGASFGGIMTFVRNLATELARDGVRIHCLSPTYVVDTPVFEAFAAIGNRGLRAQERAGLGLPSPRDIAPMALFLCGPGATKITGQIISINGGLNA